MDNLARVRQASIRVAKVQRRIWLLEAIIWPAVAIGVIVAVVALGGWAWRRRRAAAAPNDVALASPDDPRAPAEPFESRLNHASSGNHFG